MKLLPDKLSRHAAVAVRFLGSPRFELFLLVTVAIIVSVATVLQTKHGRPYSQWFVYHTTWFTGLLTLFAASVVCAMYLRWPWKPRQIGGVIIHAGLLLALAGWFLRVWSGVD